MNVLFIIIGAIIIILAYLTIQYSLLIPSPKGIPVLMYHQVKNANGKGTVLDISKFEEQMEYLQKNQYKAIGLTDFEKLSDSNKNPSRNVLITFDDAYENFYTHALPVLQKYNLKSVVFIPVAYMGKTNAWDKGSDKIMDAELLKKISKSELVELALHSYEHISYRHSPIEKIETDIQKSIEELTKKDIPFYPALAYPYGGFPKKKKQAEKNESLKNLLIENNIKFAFRIGNKKNKLPIKKIFEVTRIDVRGEDSHFSFKTKLKKGRTKIF